MTTYRGDEIPKPDQLDEDLLLVGARVPGMENAEEELDLPPEAGTERVRRPGEKHYMDTEPGDAVRPIARMQEGGRVVGQRFDPQGRGYDSDTARLAGLTAKPVPDDDVPHWPSRDPVTGMVLKGRNHPTFDLGVEHDRQEGYGLEMRDGRYYTQPFAKHEQGGMVEQPACKYGSSTVVTCQTKHR